MNRKSFYKIASIVWIILCIAIGIGMFYYFFPEKFESHERIYYEPDEEAK